MLRSAIEACGYALVFVEGINDAALVSALVHSRGCASCEVVYSEWVNLKRITDRLFYSMALGANQCFIGLVALADKRRLKKLVDALRVLNAILGGGACIILVIDSDEYEPRDRLRSLAESLRCKCLDVKEAQPCCAEARFSCRGGVVHVLAWKCSGECWIALVDKESSITSLDDCDAQLRRRCHERVDAVLGGLDYGERVRAVGQLLESSSGPWAAFIERLRSVLCDGSRL